jgi:hypothetical protein
MGQSARKKKIKVNKKKEEEKKKKESVARRNFPLLLNNCEGEKFRSVQETQKWGRAPEMAIEEVGSDFTKKHDQCHHLDLGSCIFFHPVSVAFFPTPKAMTVLLLFLIFLVASSNGQQRKVFLSFFFLLLLLFFSHLTAFNTETGVWT